MKSDDAGSILGDLTSGLDPAVRRDWEESINKIFYTTNSNVQYIKHQHHSFRLFNNSDVILFYKEEILEKTIKELQNETFKIYQIDCSTWTSKHDFHSIVSSVLEFPSYYGKNLDAFNDCLSDIYDNERDIVIVFWNYDVLARLDYDFSKTIVDIIQSQSRNAKIYGKQLGALVHTNNPNTFYKNLGAIDAEWNPDEWLNSNRGL